MGVSRSAERDDGLCPSTPQAAGAPLEHALFFSSRRLWICTRRCFRGFLVVLIYHALKQSFLVWFYYSTLDLRCQSAPPLLSPFPAKKIKTFSNYPLDKNVSLGYNYIIVKESS